MPIHPCLCSTHVPGTFIDQKRVSDPPEPELQTVVSHRVNTGRGAQVFWKSNQCS